MARYVVDEVDGQFVVFDMRGGGVNPRFGSAPTREGAFRMIVGTLHEVDGLDARAIAALTDGLSARRAAAMLGDDDDA